jgi:hypothetical protein
MFAPITVQDISFPPAIQTTLDNVGTFFEAQQQYTTVPSASNSTTQSIAGANSVIGTPILEPGGKILIGNDGGGDYQIFDTNTNTFQTVVGAATGARSGCYDPITNSWIVIGYNNIKKIPVNATGSISTCAYPTNGGATQYSSAIPLNGKVYAAPFVGMTAQSSLLIYDTVTNTATTASGALSGTAERFGSAIGGDGFLYFGAGSATTALRYNPVTNAANTITAAANGYNGMISLPNGNIFWGDFPSGRFFEYSWETKTTKTITFTPPTNPGRWARMALGADGMAYVISSRASGTPALCPVWIYDYRTGTFKATQWVLPASNTTGDRQYQGIVSLPDGRLVGLPGQGGTTTYFNIRGYNPQLFSGQSQTSGFRPNPG